MEISKERKMHFLVVIAIVFLLYLGSSTDVFTTAATTTTTVGKNNSLVLETERLALLEFKKGITHDPFRVTSSWNDLTHFCNWYGVNCSSSSSSQSHLTQSVLILNLENHQLVGILPPSIGNLTSLTAINLRNNSFHGTIPQEIGRLSKLQYLNLTRNSFTGEIPTNLSHCTDLKVLDLMYNNFVGSIPNQLSQLTNLLTFALRGNNITGTIPPWIGNLSSLSAISLAHNQLQGEIPQEIGGLTKLGYFQVSDNNLSGMIPSSIFNISSLYFFSVTSNQLHGELPSLISLPNLKVFVGAYNNFTGSIPISLGNVSSELQLLDFTKNRLTGAVPVNLGRLRNLTRLNFGSNELGFGKDGDLDIINALVNCTKLVMLGLEYNNLGGELPVSISNLSTYLTTLTMGGNMISGSVPVGIEKLVNLNVLGLEDNLFSGSIPFGIGKLMKLQELYLSVNRFSGLIPSSIGDLSILNTLFMDTNILEGGIPPSLGQCQNLILLNISYNNLIGSIPKQIFDLTSLSISLSLDHNSLSGPLPLEVGNLKKLTELELSNNKFSGQIPSTLASMITLERLNLSGNFFQGTIPQSLSGLRGMQVLDVSSNNLSGIIPEYLSSLKSLNISYNDFDGEVPKDGIFADTIGLSIVGNNKLCGGITKLKLPACSLEPLHKSRRKNLSPRVIILVSVGCLFVFMLSLAAPYYLIKKLRNKTRVAAPTSKDAMLNVSYAQLLKSTDGFSKDNLIGVGSFGSVYKGSLYDRSKSVLVAVKVLNLQQLGASKSFISECEALKNIRHRNLVNIKTACSSIDSRGNDFKALVFQLMPNGNLEQWLHPQVKGSLYDRSKSVLVAVKVLNLQQLGASKSFISECEALKNIRHRNLVNIKTACSSIDSRGNDFKALVFQLMPNGNLEQWLHPQVSGEKQFQSLSLCQRLNIAIDVASALEYLHHHCVTPIAHCDVKPSNILLDDDMTAHVSDFGLSRFLIRRTTDNSSTTLSSAGLRGSIGYISPEYGMGGRVSMFGDIYSYGILLLEMFTGKRPTDDMFKDGLNLHNFATASFPDRVMEIVDPLLLIEVLSEEEEQQEELTMGVENRNNNVGSRTMHGCLVSVIRIGISCSLPSPSDRMVMKVVVSQIHNIRKSFLESLN